jgi:predicted TIM-barrel fold metal-dependent hydrolase
VQAGRPHDRPVEVPSRHEFLDRMDRWGIGRALVYHPAALFYDGEPGNRELLEWIGDEPRLVPQWCAHLSLTQVSDFAHQAETAGVRGVRAAPRLGLYPFVPWIVDPWLGWLSETGRVLWVSLDELDPDQFHSAVSRHPQLHVVLSEGHYRHHAIIWPLMRALPNLMLELSRYDVAGGVGRLVDAFGAERFVFGSTYPDLAPEPYLFYLHHAGLDESALRAIAGGNLERLLS